MIVDFTFDAGLLFVSIRNISDAPARKVSVAFRRKFRGAGGAVVVPELNMFKNIELLAPGKEIRSFVDATDAYFRRDEPREIAAVVTFHDLDEVSYRRTVQHDLSIYEDLLFVTASTPVEGDG